MDSDSPLAAALADDLDGSFEALVLAHQDRLYSIALRVLGDPGDAEEAAQDALVRAYRAMAGYDAGADPRPSPPTVAGDDRPQPVPDRGWPDDRRPPGAALSLDAPLPGDLEPRADDAPRPGRDRRCAIGRATTGPASC